MADPRAQARRRRIRSIAPWVLSLAVAGTYFLIEAEGEVAPIVPAEPTGGKSEDLDIVEVRPNDPTPGSALTVLYVGERADRELKAQFSQDRKKVFGIILNRQPGQLIVRVPDDTKVGPVKLRLTQGEDDDDRSKPYDLRVKAPNRRKLFRSVVGGLALLVFGLHTLSSGTRSYAGQRSQGIITRIARRTPSAIGLGVVIGGITQFTTTAAGVVVGLIESHLLATGPALAILLGAQLGAAATPTLIGLTTQKESLLVVVTGVIWTTLAASRRSKALGKIILGCGLLFYGLFVLRDGFEPAVGDPELIPYIDMFRASTFPGLLACLSAGVLLAAALQGPAPVFVLVLGLAQATGRLDLQSALAILAGTGLGAAIGTNVVASPFSNESRRMARLHLLIAAAGTVFLALTVDAFAWFADSVVSGPPHEVEYGKKVLLPKMGRHLVVGFVTSQMVVIALAAAALPLVTRLLRRTGTPRPTKDPGPLLGTAGVTALRTGLVRVLTSHRAALDSVIDLCMTGHRARGTDSEHALADARHELEQLFAGAVRSRSNEPEMARLRQAALATLQLQRAVEDLLRHAERATESNLALSPGGDTWQIEARDAATIKALHGLLIEGMDALVQQLETAMTPDLDQARSREIRLNAMEMDTRQGLLADADRGGEPHAIALRLNNTDLVNAYEGVGNQLYRLHEALAAEVEQDEAPPTPFALPTLSGAGAGGGDQGN